MTRKKLSEREIRKLSKGGNSYYVTLPIEGVRNLKWKKGQKLVVDVDEKRGRMIIKDWEK